MTVQLDTQAPPVLDDWADLDVSIIEAGPEAYRLIQMTDDGCTSTCASACPASGC